MNSDNYTQITINDGYATHSTRVDEIDLDIDNLYQRVLLPTLLAVGYSESVIEEYFQGDARHE